MKLIRFISIVSLAFMFTALGKARQNNNTSKVTDSHTDSKTRFTEEELELRGDNDVIEEIRKKAIQESLKAVQFWNSHGVQHHGRIVTLVKTLLKQQEKIVKVLHEKLKVLKPGKKKENIAKRLEQHQKYVEFFKKELEALGFLKEAIALEQAYLKKKGKVFSMKPSAERAKLEKVVTQKRRAMKLKYEEFRVVSKLSSGLGLAYCYAYHKRYKKMPVMFAAPQKFLKVLKKNKIDAFWVNI